MSAPLQENLEAVRARIARAARDAGRDPKDVALLAVTKAVSVPLALALARVGARELGENRVAGLEAKARAFEEAGEPVHWHFVGHLQRNKARRVVQRAGTIHSIDSLRLLETVARIAVEEQRQPALYLQVKLDPEEEKSGFEPAEVPGAVEAAARLAGEDAIELAGLMAMAPLVAEDRRRARAERTFEALASLAATLPSGAFRDGEPQLSMGMSGDLEQAVAAGSHLVRIGRALYRGIEDPGPTSSAARAPEEREEA